jgi:hypothetical protein
LLEKQEESHGFSRIATDRKEEERRQTKAPRGLKKDLAARHRFAVGAMSGSVRRRGVLFSRKERAWGVYGECLASRFPSRLDGASGQVANSAGLATWKWPAWPVGHLAIWPLHLPGRVNGRVVQNDMNGAGLGRALHKLPQQPEKEQWSVMTLTVGFRPSILGPVPGSKRQLFGGRSCHHPESAPQSFEDDFRSIYDTDSLRSFWPSSSRLCQSHLENKRIRRSRRVYLTL